MIFSPWGNVKREVCGLISYLQ